MTFTDIVNEIKNRLNLTSTDATTRIGVAVNRRYKRVTSSTGLNTSRRTIISGTVDPTNTTLFPKLPEMEIEGLEKVTRITTVGNGEDSQGIQVLKELTFDEIANMKTFDRFPRAFAVKRMGPSSVTVTLDAFPPTTPFLLTVEGYGNLTDLAGDDEPQFPADFHEILIEGGMADELRKMEKPQLSQMADQNYERLLSELRYFIAKSAYLDIAQGKDKPQQLWYRPWFTRIGLWA